MPAGTYDDQTHANDQQWASPRALPAAPVAAASIRNPSTAAAGAATDLTATVINANGVRLTWTDHASDAEGYLVEVEPAGSTRFTVVQLVDPNINSCGVITLPDEKRAAFG